jgi:hypothetical protein
MDWDLTKLFGNLFGSNPGNFAAPQLVSPQAVPPVDSLRAAEMVAENSPFANFVRNIIPGQPAPGGPAPTPAPEGVRGAGAFVAPAAMSAAQLPGGGANPGSRDRRRCLHRVLML